MKRATLSRRLLASVAGLAVGLTGALALTTPAQAHSHYVAKVEGPRVGTSHVTDCDGLKIKLRPYAPRSGNSFRVLDANGDLVWPEGVDVEDDAAVRDAGWIDHGSWQFLWLDGDTAFPVEVSYWSGSNPGGADWRSAPFDGVDWPVVVDWEPAAGKWPDCGDSPRVEIVEDCDGKITVTIHAGDTRREWRVGEDDSTKQFIEVSESANFEATSLDVLVEWKHKGEFKEADEGYVTRTPAEDCPPGETPPPSQTPPPDEENGEGGGELPVTGGKTTLVAGAALLLLSLGGGLYFMARRRRISFTT